MASNVLTLLQNNFYGQLKKIAKFYDSSGNVVEEYRTFPESEVGEECVGITYAYDLDGNITGERSFLTTWNQSMEDQVVPSVGTITDITLSNSEISEAAVVGDAVGTLSTVGAIAPYTYTITADPGNKFELVANQLKIKNPIFLAESPYTVDIKSTSKNGIEYTKQFTIQVIPLYANTVSTFFDGITQRVEFGDVFGFEMSQQWSISMWFYADNLAAQRCLYSKYYSINTYGYTIQISTAGLPFIQVRTSNGTYNYTGAQAVLAQTWNHIVVTFNGGGNMNGMRVYVNNVLDTIPPNVSISGTINYGQPAMLGDRNGAYKWSGNIDEVALWNKALSAAEVSEVFAGPNDVLGLSSAASLVAFYRMGDGDTFPTITDHVFSNDGTMINMSASNFDNGVP